MPTVVNPRTKEELEARRDVVRLSKDAALAAAYEEAEARTRGMSPTAGSRLAYKFVMLTLPEGKALAVSKAVRWQRMIERDYPEKR